jgi:hypothetical protein
MQTEFPFTLPRGYVDAEGAIHREGAMRLATAQDEVLPLKDPRVQTNPGYFVVILLARVVTRLGDLPDVNPRIVEGLFAGDLAYLEDLYQRINENGHARLAVTCPHCDGVFEVETDGSGG